MTGPARAFIAIGAISLTIAAALSALGFHALDLPEAKQRSWEWAVDLHAWHSLGLMLLGLVHERLPGSRLLYLSAALMIAGLFLFSGSIYLESLGAPETIGQVAPMGGSSFMLGWVSLALAVLLGRRSERRADPL